MGHMDIKYMIIIIIMIHSIFLFYFVGVDNGAAARAMVIHVPEAAEGFREKQITVLSVQYIELCSSIVCYLRLTVRN